MKSRNIIQLSFCLVLATCVPLPGQETGCDPPIHHQDSLPPEPTVPDRFESDSPEKIFRKKFWKGFQITGGQLTLPFKIRSKASTNSFRLTTDVTVGAYIGATKKISAKKDYRLIVPLAAGLTFININDSNTVLDQPLQEAEVVPGITWSTGLILELEKYSLGLMFGKDYASEVGDQWNYHRKIWWSFGIGFTFFH